MAKCLATIKAIITRLVFAIHGIIAIWQVTIFRNNPFYWYLSSPILLLFFEGVFTLTIKENQEWKWFCPSVFLYLASIVPAIWLLELDKVERRIKVKETFNLTSSTTTTTTTTNLKELNNLIGVEIKLPEIPLSTETWITLIEQFLMLILIIGRWMLPKGDLTRDQLSQLLLVYIGTAADIIEFFDSFKDDKVVSEPLLVLLTLAIWSWSLMQFTVVLTATKARKSRFSSSTIKDSKSCCTIDVWGIALNITLQDAPFLAFRLLLITHFRIISYMNVFFTCKNTLVILLQIYRLYVVYSEHRKKQFAKLKNAQLTDIAIISKPNMYGERIIKEKSKKQIMKKVHPKILSSEESEDSSQDSDLTQILSYNNNKQSKNIRKDTGYSTGSSHTSGKKHRHSHRHNHHQHHHHHQLCDDNNKVKNNLKDKEKQKKKLKDHEQAEIKGKNKKCHMDDFSEEHEMDFYPPPPLLISPINERKIKKKPTKKTKTISVSASSSDSSSE